MTNTSTISPSGLLETVESLPFPDRLRYTAGLSATQRRALRNLLDDLTSAPPGASEGGGCQTERLALMMGLDGLEQTDRDTGGTSPVQMRKGTNKVAVGALAVGVVGAVIAVSAKNRSNSHSDNEAPVTAADFSPPYLPAPSGPTTSSNPYADPNTSSSPGPIGGELRGGSLQSEIDAGRAELRLLESRLRSMKTDLDLLEGELSGYKAEIERQESNARLGLYVNEYGYRAALNSYNALVPQYNLQLQTYNSRYTEYQRVLNRTNQLIDQYNAGQRR